MRVLAGLIMVICSASQAVLAADTNAGKVLVQARCASCHQPADWQGETTGSLASLIRDVVSGKVKHSKFKVELSDAEIADITAYWLSVRK